MHVYNDPELTPLIIVFSIKFSFFSSCAMAARNKPCCCQAHDLGMVFVLYKKIRFNGLLMQSPCLVLAHVSVLDKKVRLKDLISTIGSNMLLCQHQVWSYKTGIKNELNIKVNKVVSAMGSHLSIWISL